jgi:hypothetical protein
MTLHPLHRSFPGGMNSAITNGRHRQALTRALPKETVEVEILEQFALFCGPALRRYPWVRTQDG